MLPGMTLVELMIAIGIVVFGMGGLSLLFVRSWTTNGFILETGLASSAASRIVRETVADLRKIRQADNGDYPLESGGDFDLEAYIDIDDDGVTERVHYYLDSGDFKRGVTEPTTTQPVVYPSGDQVTATLASDIANEATEPVFEYYNEDYPGDMVNNPLSTPVSISEVRLIKVRLMINIDPANAPDDTNIESMAELRNISAYVP